MYKSMLVTEQELKLLLEIIESSKHNGRNIHIIKRRIEHLINAEK